MHFRRSPPLQRVALRRSFEGEMRNRPGGGERGRAGRRLGRAWEGWRRSLVKPACRFDEWERSKQERRGEGEREGRISVAVIVAIKENNQHLKHLWFSGKIGHCHLLTTLPSPGFNSRRVHYLLLFLFSSHCLFSRSSLSHSLFTRRSGVPLSVGTRAERRSYSSPLEGQSLPHSRRRPDCSAR